MDAARAELSQAFVAIARVRPWAAGERLPMHSSPRERTVR
jgi:hypothetical protein